MNLEHDSAAARSEYEETRRTPIHSAAAGHLFTKLTVDGLS